MWLGFGTAASGHIRGTQTHDITMVENDYQISFDSGHRIIFRYYARKLAGAELYVQAGFGSMYVEVKADNPDYGPSRGQTGLLVAGGGVRIPFREARTHAFFESSLNLLHLDKQPLDVWDGRDPEFDPLYAQWTTGFGVTF